MNLYVLDANGKRISGPHPEGEIAIPAGCALWDGSGEHGYYITRPYKDDLLISLEFKNGQWVAADRTWQWLRYGMGDGA